MRLVVAGLAALAAGYGGRDRRRECATIGFVKSVHHLPALANFQLGRLRLLAQRSFVP
jgi:hypothetical protein